MILTTHFGNNIQRSIGFKQTLKAFASFSTVSKTKKDVDWLIQNVDLDNQHVLVRADLNVPFDKENPSKIKDDTRIREFLPTLKRLQDANARVVVCSHLGRPKGKVNEGMRLEPVAKHMSHLLNMNVVNTDDCIGEKATQASQRLGKGEVLLLENVRFHKEEEANDVNFARALQQASNANIYVNDAFGTAHRAHASTAGVCQFMDICVAGDLMEKEIRFLKNSVDHPERPMAAVLGGAKISTKLPVIQSLISKCDKILLGGAMIFTFYKARGLEVGNSLVEDSFLDSAKQLELDAKAAGVELLLPTDLLVSDDLNSSTSTVAEIDSIPTDKMGLDIGPASIALFQHALSDCKLVVWNGPMGAFENPAFSAGTFSVAQSIADSDATSIVGGGDSVAALHQSGIDMSLFSHISTGGGASLEMLEGKELPGVKCLDDL